MSAYLAGRRGCGADHALGPSGSPALAKKIERGTQFASFDGRVAGHIEYKRVLSLTDKLFIVEVKTVPRVVYIPV